jgi:ABC-2 type transport system permease protein
MWNLLRSLIVKELQAILRDPQSRLLLFLPVLLQAVLFPLAATLELKNATVAIYDQDGSLVAREIGERMAHTSAFTHTLALHSEPQLHAVMDRQDALLVLVIPEDFSRHLAERTPAPLQLILDGRRSNSAQIAFGYVQRIVDDVVRERAGGAPDPVVVRHWFNPNLDYRWFIMPSLIAIITTLGALIVTALSLAREREQGTLDQLLVTPLTPALIMLGKAIPAVMISVIQATMILLVGILAYHVPFSGSVLLLYTAMIAYALALVGFGLLISTISNTQQQALLGVFTFMMPAVLLSGYVAPVENMPAWLQPVTWIDPLRPFIVISKGIYLKNLGLAGVLQNLWPLLLISVGTNALALLLFRRQTA